MRSFIMEVGTVPQELYRQCLWAEHPLAIYTLEQQRTTFKMDISTELQHQREVKHLF